MKVEKLFTRLLLQWNREENTRVMPWKGERDPYKVWLSEVILQQTRVEQGWKYYEKFSNAYPDIFSLAAANDEDVFKLWEGLGYYTRCRNLLYTARVLAGKYNGVFPATYDSIASLKGVGSYTASAIASFCFDLPHAVVDGNVLRVLARYFGIDKPVDTPEGKRYFTLLAQNCLDKKNAGVYNQALMDFGATICKPMPDCNICPFQKTCAAFKSKQVLKFPVKLNRPQKKERWLSYFVFIDAQKKFVQQRRRKDIWQNLYEFYPAETDTDPAWNRKKINSWLYEQLGVDSFILNQVVPAKPQTLTHRIIKGYFIEIELLSVPVSLQRENNWLTGSEIGERPFPRFLHQYLSLKKEHFNFSDLN